MLRLRTMTSPLQELSHLRARDIEIYRICDDTTEVLIYLMVVFTPWAFGTTQPWSIWTMNVAGYVLGGLLAAKLFIRLRKGYLPATWLRKSPGALNALTNPKPISTAALNVVLALATALILSYCLISAINARATYRGEIFGFDYHPYLSWLPHSFDSQRSWVSFWNYLALALAFWAVVDWLPGKTVGEQRAARQKNAEDIAVAAPLLPTRLRRLLWVLSINGALVGIEGIIQRLEGSGRLLFLIKPVINPGAESQFGPYHYRANAAAYFDLLWPICLGFWWTLHRSRGFKENRHHLLLCCGIIMAACPMITSSRGGALVSLGILILAAFFILSIYLSTAAHRDEDKWTRRLTLGLLGFFFSATLTLGFALGWNALKPRLLRLQEGFAGRQSMYETAQPMAKDYPIFGTGPGSFERLFQLYRSSTETYWPAQ